MSIGMCVAFFVLGFLVREVLANWSDPSFRWGFTHPFGPPRPWWSNRRRVDYLIEHGTPWRN